MPKLTKRFVDLALPGDKDLFYWDDDIPGYGLRIKPSGVKSYLVQYRQGKRSRRMTLGRHGVITADEARKLAKKELGSVAHGKDPAQERSDDRQAPTVVDLATDYMERHARPNKRPSSIRNDRQMLDNQILPKLGAQKVADVARRDLESILLGLSKTPYRANRVRALLSKMFSLAVQWGWRADNPVLGIPKYQEEMRERWLRQEELDRLFDALDKHANQKCANIVRLLALTGARKSEVLKMTWGQVDLNRGVWTKPSHLTKQKKNQHFPLSDAAVQILASINSKGGGPSAYVFPSRLSADEPTQDIKRFWREIQRNADLADVRMHDLRHTFASHLVSSGTSEAIVGRLLGHTQPQTTRRYAHLADDPLRKATNKIGRLVQ